MSAIIQNYRQKPFGLHQRGLYRPYLVLQEALEVLEALEVQEALVEPEAVGGLQVFRLQAQELSSENTRLAPTRHLRSITGPAGGPGGVGVAGGPGGTGGPEGAGARWRAVGGLACICNYLVL